MTSQTGYNDVEGSCQGISSHELQLRDLPSKRLLGEGLAGIGYETEWEGKRCVRKDFVGVQSNIFQIEASNLVSLEDHKNIVKTYGWTVDKRSCSLVLEFMDDDLLGFLQKRKEYKRNLASDDGSGTQHDPSHSRPFKLVEALNVIMEIAEGMKQLHDRGIAHGDLKTRNILVNYINDLGETNSLSVKVADFGLAQTKRKSIFFVSRRARKLDMVQWKAPEYLRKLISLGKLEDNDETSSESDSNSEENTCTRSSVDSDPIQSHDVFEADVYSFAVTCSQILTGEDPYPNLNWKELVDKILHFGLRPKLPDACPPSLKELLQSCLDKEPNRRPPFSDIQKRLQVILRDLSQHGYNYVGEDVITREDMEAGPCEVVTRLEAVDEIQTVLEPLSVSQTNKREVRKENVKHEEEPFLSFFLPQGTGKGGGGGEGGKKKVDGENKDGDKNVGGKKGDKKEAVNKPKIIELKVHLCCEFCARKIRRKLEKLDGVEKGVIIDMYEDKVTVKATTKPETVLKQAQKVKKNAVMWPQKKEPEKDDERELDDGRELNTH